MNWTESYHREERITWDDIANKIRETVTMSDAIEAYTPEYIPRNRRMPCPIHNGKDYNFTFTTTGFKCFVCNESGDVIEYVRLVCNLKERTDAMKKINNDFRLNMPLGETITGADSFEVERRRRAVREREMERKRLETIYDAALDRYTFLDILKREAAPKKGEELTLQYVFACRNIDAAWHEVEEAIDALNEFEHRVVVTN